MRHQLFRAALIAASLLLPAVGARAQLAYTCEIVLPPPPSTTFAAPAASTTICPVNAQLIRNGAGVGLILNFSSGAIATASVQVTGSQDPGSSTAVWNNHDYLVNETGSQNGNIIFPVTAVRLYLSAYTSGTITLDLVQAAK